MDTFITCKTCGKDTFSVPQPQSHFYPDQTICLTCRVKSGSLKLSDMPLALKYAVSTEIVMEKRKNGEEVTLPQPLEMDSFLNEYFNSKSQS